jgi:hypothetical protein
MRIQSLVVVEDVLTDKFMKIIMYSPVYKINYILLALKSSVASEAYFRNVSKHSVVRLFKHIQVAEE